MKKVLASVCVVTGLILVTGSASGVFACECNPNGPPCQSYFEVDRVFVGTVRSISADPQPSPTQMLRVEFADVQTADGRTQPVVRVLTPDNDAECGYMFRTGERYVVYAKRKGSGGDLQVLSCSRTQPLASASADLQYFQALSSPSEGAHVYGTIVRSQTDPVTNATQLAPIAGVLLSLRGPRGTFDAKTGSDGRYEIFPIPPGKYELTAVTPSLTGNALQQSFDLRHSRACFVADFVFPPTALHQ